MLLRPTVHCCAAGELRTLQPDKPLSLHTGHHVDKVVMLVRQHQMTPQSLPRPDLERTASMQV